MSLLVFILGFLIATPGEVHPVLQYDDFDQEISLLDHMLILEDSTEALSFDSILISKKFISYKNRGLKGYIDGDTWIKLTVVNKGRGNLIFKVKDPMIAKVDIYYQAGDSLVVLSGGRSVPLFKRKLKFNKPTFSLPTKQNEPLEVFIKLYKGVDHMPDIVIGNTAAIRNSLVSEQLASGIYLGIVFGMIVLTLFLGLTTNSRIYFDYIFVVMSISLSQASIAGYTTQYLWPNNTWLTMNDTALFLSLSVISLVRFSSIFLKASDLFSPFFKKLLNNYLWVGLLLLITSLFLEREIASRIHNIVILIGLLTISVIGLKAAILNVQVAKFFVIGWFAFSISLILYILAEQGIISIHFYDIRLLHLGSAIESFAFFLGISLNFNQLSIDKVNAKNETIATLSRLQEREAKLQKTQEELDLFVYRTSHDLRSPLASILGLVNIAMLENRIEEHNKYWGMVGKEVRRLDTVTLKITDYSRNSKTAVEAKSIVLSELVKKLLETIQPQPEVDSKAVCISSDEEIPFRSDLQRIEIIVENLISNALTFQDPQKGKHHVFIQIAISRKEAEIVIKDNGCGIPEPYQEDIFKMFYRLDHPLSGSGLGLFLVKESLARLKGNIEMKSSKEGTWFCLKIPNQFRFEPAYQYPLELTRVQA